MEDNILKNEAMKKTLSEMGSEAESGREAVLQDTALSEVDGGFSYKPANCGGNVDQYQVKEGTRYYYHYTGGGHDQWMPITVVRVYEKAKVLWFTERFATVLYESGLTGDLPLDTGDVYYML